MSPLDLGSRLLSAGITGLAAEKEEHGPGILQRPHSPLCCGRENHMPFRE
ncbi:hypothetical protein LEMLEM_LOCUS4402 [Lemmus lemmus]